MKLKNILRQEKYNKLNKHLFFGLAILFFIAAIVNKSLFMVFIAFCFAVVGFSPQGAPTKTERMQQVADEVAAVYGKDEDDEETTEDDSDEGDIEEANIDDEESEDSE